MTRLLSTIKLDVMLQMRSKLYHISIGLALILVGIVRYFFEPEALKTVLPAFFLLALAGTTYMFVAGMIIFEKNEHTLDALIVTPLQTRDYLISKLITLTFITVIEASIITLIGYGFNFNPFYLYSGVLLMGFITTLAGITQVVRYNSVTDFLVSAFAIALIAQLPIFLAFDIWPNIQWIWYIIPTAAPYILIRGGFETLTTWELVYSITYSFVWLIVLAIWVQRAFYNHIIMGGEK